MIGKVILLLISTTTAVHRHHHHHHIDHSLINMKDDPACSSQGCGPTTLHFEGEGDSDHPIDYKVADFGVDHDIISSNTNMDASEKKFDNSKWLPDAPAEYPRGYAVPTFGMDRDIMQGLTNIKVAEKITNQKWKWNGDAYKNPARHNPVVPYYANGSKLADDIVVSQNNLAAAEKSLDEKMVLP